MFVFSAGASGYKINNSLRFRASASAWLSKTFAGAGNRLKWTWSAWVKRGTLSSVQTLFASAVVNGSSEEYIAFDASDNLRFYDGFSATLLTLVSNAYRDPAAWYHIMYVYDSAQGTQANRGVFYINGVAATASTNGIGASRNSYINGALSHGIARFGTIASNNFDGYLSEVNFIDGQALTPSSFGQIDAATGQWVAKKYTGTYGINGFYLDFKDPTSTTTLCADKSGNGNNWTPNGISVTAGVTYDSMLDVPAGNGGGERGNYAVLSALGGGLIPTNGNLTCNQGAASWASTPSTISQTTGKWYFEIGQNGVGVGNYTGAGLRPPGMVGAGEYAGSVAGSFGLAVNNTGIYSYSGGVAGPTMSGTYTAASVFQVVVDFDAGKIWFGDGTSYVGGGNPISGTFPTYTFAAGTELVPYVCAFALQTNVNFGQRPFTYTPPTGFKALHTGNLPTPVIKKPSDHFNVVLATGANIKSTAEALYSSFLEWIKDRGNVNNHQLIDIVRGSSAVLQSNTTGAETTYSAPAGSSVGWVWKAGGAAVANNAGSIASQVSVNAQAGFSIVTYTGTGANATVGHGLGIAPKMVITKRRTGAAVSWGVYHASIGASNALYLDLTNASAASTNWNGTPTSTVFGIGDAGESNLVSQNYVAYCFAEVPGFSKFGSYTGNGSADGPFVYCGFRPRYVMVKRADTSTFNWIVWDSARNAYNVTDLYLNPNGSSAEATGVQIDFTSNGFKARSTDGNINANAGTYIFAAFAEAPFNYANAR